MKTQTTQKMSHRRSTAAAFAALALLLAGCSGGTENRADGDPAAASNEGGFEYGATQEEIHESIADLEPVELVMQPGGDSPESSTGRSAAMFAEEIEDMSNGQISIELVWGNAIASFSELEGALTDGRLDLAQHGPLYFPDSYPHWNDLAVFSQYSPSTPLLGSAVSAAMIADLAWGSEAVIEEFESKNLTPLHPMLPIGQWMTACSSPGSDLDHWRGNQIRVASPAQTYLSEAVGASPVSMEFTEVFEALQRNTVDCAWAQVSTSVANGLPQVAPHFSYPTEGSFAGQSGIAILAGTSFKELPLAYQQIIFDAGAIFVEDIIEGLVSNTVIVQEMAESNGGGFVPLDEEAQQKFFEVQAQEAQEVQNEGSLGEDIIERAEQSSEKWEAVALSTGLEEGESIETISEWYEDGTSFETFVNDVYEEIYAPHRPN